MHYGWNAFVAIADGCLAVVGGAAGCDPGQDATPQRRIEDLEGGLNERVYALFQLSKDEVRLIEESTQYRYGEV